MKKYIYISVFFLTLLSSCEKVFMEPNPETDNLAIFNEYATLVKEKHAMLEFKNVDIIHLTDSIGATINESMSESDLFQKLGIITKKLRDGHSSLSKGKGEDNRIDYVFEAGYESAFNANILFNVYLQNTNNNIHYLFYDDGESIKAIYGFLPQDNEIAYLWIPSWDVEIDDDKIDELFSTIKGAKGLIIDIRQNTGGDPSLAAKFASYLTNKSIYTGFERFKTGPGVNDFSDSKIYLHPTNSSSRFLKPVAVLTDRLSYSASTTFAYSVNPLQNITFIGQKMGGGSGSFSDGFLANGWKWSLSTSEFIDHLGNHLDDGFEPDIAVSLDTLITNKDEVVERALLELQK